MLGILSCFLTCFAQQEEGQAAPFSVPPETVNPAEGVDAWLLLASGSRTGRENTAEQLDVLEEGEKHVRSKEKPTLPWQ